MLFEVTILGTSSAFPAHGRFPSAQVVRYHEDYFLVDCGEGTQIRMTEYKIRRTKIHHVFISHLHGDHIFGLPGLINSYHHYNRNEPLHLYGPPGLRQLIDTTLRLTQSMINFDLIFHEILTTTLEKILEYKGLKIYAFPLRHRVPTFGYLFREKQAQANLRKDVIQTYGLSIEQIKAAKLGEPVDLDDGRILSHAELTEPPLSPRSYAYCSDTAFDRSIIPWIRDTDLLYHEATFMHDLEAKAKVTGHSTAFQAGMMAHLANAGQLLLGHFSGRYTDLEPLAAEAKEVFARTLIASEGQSYPVIRRDDLAMSDQ